MSSNDPPGPSTGRAPEHSATHQTSTSSHASQQQPPFPISGTSPDTRSPPPAHPNAEHLLNAAAKHIIPDYPAPSAEDEEDKAQITKPGKDEDQRENREEEPLLRGTPLDELLTPGLGLGQEPQGGQLDNKTTASKSAASESRPRASTYAAPSRQTGRPGFGAVRGVGSDSVSVLFLLLHPLPPSCFSVFFILLLADWVGALDTQWHALPRGVRVLHLPL